MTIVDFPGVFLVVCAWIVFLCAVSCPCRGWAWLPWLAGAPASYTPAAHLVISAILNTLVFPPPDDRLSPLIPTGIDC